MTKSISSRRQLKFASSFFFVLVALILSSCASYHLGKGKRTLPGGYDRVAVPMFANKTQEVGIEPYFTQSLRLEFERSRLARVVSAADAQMVVEGTITKLVIVPIGAQINNTSTALLSPNPVQDPLAVTPATGPQNPLPSTSVMNTQYNIIVDVHINARKASDNSVVWSSDFESQRQFAAALLGTPMLKDGTPGINTSDPLYNNVARQDTVARLARDMMQEAHDRLTENF